MKKIGIVAKTKQPISSKVISDLADWLRKKGIEAFLETETAKLVSVAKHWSKFDLPSMVDMIVVLGGDGTLLSVARRIKKNNVPILGVNLGFLGFMTELTLDELYPSLEKIIKGDYKIEERMTLFVEVIRDGKVIESHAIINDAVINKGELARIISLDVTINGQFAIGYRSDGLIMATPTGSTAYSLAAGGPIVYPTMDAVILSPICPHTLTNRSIVVPADVLLEVTLTTKTEHVFLTLDGQRGIPIKYLDNIILKKGHNVIKLIQVPEKNHYEVLKKKLHWGR